MQISEHHVRERAYYIWEGEGRVHGRDALHWTRAESELRTAAVPGEAIVEAAAEAPVAEAHGTPARKAAGAKAKPAAKVAAKPAAPKAKASKAAVAAGRAAKAARTPAALH